ncbi:hypothetical protein PENSUB_5050 [Penicillium subrubescens]|uniref:Uncharacterized protein n=2 Tax=Penicillium subrubescens TaxID=1316194 RepID=A0A1Q5UAR1_9EURO|nr:hypothetical protein PENSUB_5050 [Penicillium subrubescens]
MSRPGQDMTLYQTSPLARVLSRPETTRMLRCFVRSLQEKPVSGENTNSDNANVFELTVDQKYSTHYILSSGYQRAGFRFRHSIGFFSQSSGISSIMHFGMSSGISSRNRYKMGGHALRLWNYTSYFNFSIDIDAHRKRNLRVQLSAISKAGDVLSRLFATRRSIVSHKIDNRFCG